MKKIILVLSLIFLTRNLNALDVKDGEAVNSAKLGGQPATYYFDTSGSTQTKIGGLGLGGLLTVNGQVAFPATANPSTNVNTLDDYEEGTFTPIITFGGASVDITYSSQSGLYTKIGNIVIATIKIILSSKGSSTGLARVDGLPFANNATNITPFSCLLSKISFANVFTGVMEVNSTLLTLLEVSEAGVVTNIDDTNFANDSEVYISIVYKTG